MADKQLQIRISATDAASAVFRKLGTEATNATKQITTGTQQAEKGLNEMSDAATKTEQRTKALAAANTAIGVGFAALGTSIGLYSRQIVENEQQITNLQRVYGDAAGQLQAFANQVQNTTIFSSEDVIRAENAFATLKTNYGLTTEQIKQLVAASADLATANGVTLVDAATRVQAAIRGEGEAAEALGLTMNQQSIDRQNLTLTMTNQEAAQYRFNALMQQSAVYQGAAAEKAETLSGRIQQIANKFDDGARSAISFTGPLPQIISGITSIGSETGIAISGLVALGKGFKDATDAVGGLRSALSASQGLTAAIGTAGVAAAIGIAAIAAVELSNRMGSYAQSADRANAASASLDTTLMGLSTSMSDTGLVLNLDATKRDLDTVKAQIEQLRTLRDQIQSESFSQQGMSSQADIDASNARIAQLKQEYDAIVAVYGDDPESALSQQQAALQALDAIMANTGAGSEQAMRDAVALHDEYISGAITFEEYSAGLTDISANLGNYQTTALQTADANKQLTSSYADVTNAIASLIEQNPGKTITDQALALQSTTVKVLDSLNKFTEAGDTFWGLSGGAQAYAEVLKDVDAILSYSGPHAEEYQRQLAELEAMHQAGLISADTFATEVDRLAQAQDKAAATARLNAAQQDALNAAMDAGEASARKAAAGISELSETGQRGSGTLTTLRDIVDSNGETASRTAGEFTKLADAIEHVTKFAELDLGLAETVTRSYDAWRGETRALAISHDKLNDSLAGGTDELAAYIEQANKAAQSIGLLSTNAQLFQAAGIKAPSLDVAVNLQTGQGAFDAVFGAIKQAQSMSQSIGGAKSWADELIGDPGTWSELDKLLAEGRINVDQYNAAQAAQVRISEDVTNAQRDLLAVQVNLAPAMADATRQQAEYINSLQDMSAEQQLAALGFMDSAESAKAMQIAQLAAASSTDAMQASTTALIKQATDADPVLKAMLESMGLISETDTGIKVNFDEANSANSAINELTKSIDALIVALGGIPPIHTESNAPSTQKDVDNLTDSINDIPDSSTTVIDALDQASGTIAIVGDLLRNLDGRTANVYVNAIRTGDTLAAVGAGLATGGTISAMATGGTLSADIPRYAIGGTHGGSYAIVGDGGGPEMVWLPTGAQVTNAVATRSKRESIEARRGGDINIYGPMTLNPAGSDAYAAIQQEMMGGARR